MSPRRPDGLWRTADFLKVWAGQSLSSLGGAVSDVALPLVAIVVVGASAFEFSVVRALTFLPFLLFALPAGVWLDRVRRRPVVVGADAALGLALLSIPLAHWLGLLTVWQLFVVAFAVGTLEVSFGIAYRSYLPTLVPRERLLDANAKLDTTASAASVAGPGLGGILVGALGAPAAVVVDAVSFAVSAVLGLAVRAAEPEPLPQAGRRLREELAEGLAFVARHPQLRPIAVTTAALNFARSLVLAVFLVYAVRELGVSAGELGLVLACGNVGALVGAAVSTRLALRIGAGRAILATAATIAPATLFVAAAPTEGALPFLVVAQVLTGFGALGYSITSTTLRQSVTPDALLGRMNSVMIFLGFSGVPLGSLAGGALASAFGLHAAIWIGAALAPLAVAPLLATPIRSVRGFGEAQPLPAR